MHAQHLNSHVHQTFERCRTALENCEAQSLHARQMLKSLADQATSSRERNRIEVMIATLERRFTTTFAESPVTKAPE